MAFKRGLLVATLSTVCLAAQAATFSFGLWGDMPYAKNKDGERTAAVVKSINAHPIAFSIFDGDIKDGSSECHNKVFTEAAGLFNSMKRPVVYVPGDNEWTDCHRTNNGGYNNIERLGYLRQTMFAKPTSFGRKTLKLEHQGAPGELMSENTRWFYRGVMFVGLNIPGSNNNLVDSDKSCTKKSARSAADCEQDNAEYRQRDAANIEWMTASFEKAKALKARGIVIVFQADPGFDLPETEDEDESKQPQFAGYQAFMGALTHLTEDYEGQVLVVHGDTHYFKVDKPLHKPLNLLPNFTRIQTFGSPSNHWVRVSVDTRTAEVFTVHPVIVKP